MALLLAILISAVYTTPSYTQQSAGGRKVAQRQVKQSSLQPITVVDGLGDTVRLDRPAKRVISLLASGTESLIELGLSSNIVGRTIYDKDPRVAHVKLVGSGLEPNLETLVSLKPDLVIGWAAERRQKLQQRLKQAGITTYNLAAQDTSDIFKGIKDLGALTGKSDESEKLLARIRAQFTAVKKSVEGKKRPKVLYIVSMEPPITVNSKTYVGQVIGVAGGQILFPDTPQNWPTVSLEQIAVRNPDYIILPVGEFKQNAIERMRVLPGWRSLEAVKNNRVIVIDADLINRPGPRVGEIAEQIRNAIHPGSSRSK